MSPAHRQLINLLARQAVREHLTAESRQRRAREQDRQNRPLQKRAVND